MRLLVCASAVALLAAALPASAGARSTCLSPGYRTIYTNHSGGIFRTANGIRLHRDGYYVCLFRYGYRVRVGGNQAPKKFSFGGHFFATSGPAGWEGEGAGPLPAGINVYDLSQARRAKRYAFNTTSAWPGTMDLNTPPASLVTGDPVTALVVTANGGLAWIAKPLPGGADYQVMTTRGRHFRRVGLLLDSGPGIGPKSLRHISRSSVSWTNGGVVRHAKLPGN